MNDRTFGRGAFLGIVGLGLAGLFYGRTATGALGSLVPDSVGTIVPTGGWRIYTIASQMPELDPAAFRLRIDGLVKTPTTYTLADLRRMPTEQQVSDFHCVTGWSVNDVTWNGVRLKTLLSAAGPLSGARALRFVSAERPYDDSLTLEQAFLPDVMLAFDMDGSPLSRPHGGPVRLVMPRMYGYKNVKWVDRIEVIDDENYLGYWEQRGYDRDAWLGRSNGFTA
jgi:DMSO/TMAO reductase YedYZ molybdopterin-dependent catalytic subunit